MLKWLCCVLLIFGMAMPVRSATMESAALPEKSIHFKADRQDSDSASLRYVTALILFALIAGGALFLLCRRIPELLLRGRQGSRLNVLERRSIGSRAQLYLLEVDGNLVLLVQSGERLLQIDPSLTIPSLRHEARHG